MVPADKQLLNVFMYFSETSRTSSFPFAFFAAFLFVLPATTAGQERARVVKEKDDKPVVQRTVPTETSETGLTNSIIVRREVAGHTPLVKRTSSSAPAVNTRVKSSGYYSATVKSMMLNSIRQKIGIRYRYGTQGPSRYDCSGFVWKVFSEAGLPFTRTSAAQYWRSFEPATGEDRYEFGTLVFFNRLGHVGIVVSKEGFYHASTSKGVTYSKFRGYWEKRIVGFRRVPLSALLFDDGQK